MEIKTPLSSPEIPANYESTKQSDTEIPNCAISGNEQMSLSHAIMQATHTISQESHVQAESFDLFEENRALSPDSLSECPTLYECLMKTSESRATSPEPYTSMNKYRQLSPDSPIPVHRPLLPGAEFLAERRPSSPETIFSVNEFQKLSSDSPIPEYLTLSLVPSEHRSETSFVPMQHEYKIKALSPLQSKYQSSDFGSEDPENWSSWHPLPEWTIFEPKPLLSISDNSDTDSQSLSPQSFYFDSELRNPSPEAATLETEITETIYPEPLIFETFYQTESPVSGTFESECDEFVDNVSDLSIHDSEGIKENDLSLPKNDAALVNQLTFEQCRAQIKSLSEIEALETFPKTNTESPSIEELKPKSSYKLASEPRLEDIQNSTKSITSCEEKDTNIPTGASASKETSEGHTILKKDERQMESQQQHEEALGQESSELAPQESKERENVSKKAIHLEPQETDLAVRQGDKSSMISKITTFSDENSSDHTIATHGLILEHQLKLIASSLTSESSKESDPGVTTNIPEQIFAFEAHKSNVPPHPSPEGPRASTGSQELNSFQFHLQDTHRRVTPNLTASSQLSLSLESSDYSNLLSRSIVIPSTGTQVSPTDLSPIYPVFSTSSSDLELSPVSCESLSAAGIFQVTPGFKYVLSEFEETLSSFVGEKPQSNIVFPGMYPLVAAMTHCSLKVTQELKASELPARLSDDQKLLDATAVLDVDSPLYNVNLKAWPRPVHADSTESDVEFFDCHQTFSDKSEPEDGSAEFLDVAQMVYQVEEPASLTSSPENLTGIPKLKEYTQLKKDDRPLSWGSEDLDLPLDLEPEDEYTGEEKAYAYDYASDHTFAEELPPRERAQYDDDDDDSLGRVSCLA
ncbi:titin homolog isoform X2 [Myxocyprinus asiaticus]|uniref:titin homolog isoform X2 n=1 Tax=Myxocyprinus asiaticus TaxID=70543 RepID=UPI002221C1F9|nr:titin homolog isoform X2 [Myxocyprinus asiaticus]